MSAKSTKRLSGYYPLGTTTFRLPYYLGSLDSIKKNKFFIDDQSMLCYEDTSLVYKQTIFPCVNFKFYLMDPQGRFIVDIIEIKKTPEQILVNNNYKLKAYRLQNGEIAFKLGVYSLDEFLSEGMRFNK